MSPSVVNFTAFAILSGSTSPYSVTIPATTEGNMLVVIIEGSANANTWTVGGASFVVKKTFTSSTLWVNGEIASAFNISAGITSITFTFTGTTSNQVGCWVFEITGVSQTSDPFDQVSIYQNAYNTNSLGCGSITPSTNGLVVALFDDTTTATTVWTKGSSWTLGNSSASDPNYLYEYQVGTKGVLVGGTSAQASVTQSGNETDGFIFSINSPPPPPAYSGHGGCAVNTITVTGSNINSATAMPIPGTLGNLIVVVINILTSGAVTGVVDSSGTNVYVSAGTAATSTGGDCEIWYAVGATTGVISVTASWSGGNTGRVGVYDISGADPYNPLDSYGSLSNQTATNIPIGPTVNPTTPGRGVVIAGLNSAGAVTQIAQGYLLDLSGKGIAHFTSAPSVTSPHWVTGASAAWGGVTASFMAPSLVYPGDMVPGTCVSWRS
jgi:hypothetical protein